MNITNKDITNDVSFIVNSLKGKDVTIPSFLTCAAPGVAFMLGISAWQFFVAYPGVGMRKMDRILSHGSIGLSIVLGFFVFITITQLISKYLSMPSDVRERSIILSLIKSKSMFYFGLWLVLNVAVGIAVKMLSISPLVSYGVQLVSIVIIWFVALADFSRYEISMLSAAIKAWREGGDLSGYGIKG